MPLIQNIDSKNWSLSAQTQGEIVTDLGDISQCIYIIITTIRGSDPLRPDFGVDISGFVDRPTPKSRAAAIVEITQAVALWEPRAIVDRIVSQESQGAVEFSIYWHSGLNVGNTNVKI